jgi:hypothetical protein
MSVRPDLVTTSRIGPARSERVADWLAGQETITVKRPKNRDFILIPVETSSCRNIVIRCDERTDRIMDDDEVLTTALSLLRRIQEHRMAKGILPRIRGHLASVARYAKEATDEASWITSAETATPWSHGRVKPHVFDVPRSERTLEITPPSWRSSAPCIVAVHGDRDIIMSAMYETMTIEDDPMVVMRTLSEGAALVDGIHSSIPWVLPTDETPR